MTEPELTLHEEDLLSGHRGEAARIAMRIILEMARVAGAPRLIDVRSAHIDGCLYHGRAGLDFAERLASAGGGSSFPPRSTWDLWTCFTLVCSAAMKRRLIWREGS
jgi:predicted aconitase